MSVLFKALQRAEKVRGGDAGRASGDGGIGVAAAADPLPRGMPALGRRHGRRGGIGRLVVRLLGLSFILSMTASIAAMVLFRDEVEDAFATLVLGVPAQPPRPAALPAPVPAPVAPVPAPAEPTSAPSVAAVPEAAPPADAAPAPAPAPAEAPPPDGTGGEDVGEAAGEAVAVAPPAAAVPDTATTTDIATLMAAARVAQGAPSATPSAAAPGQGAAPVATPVATPAEDLTAPAGEDTAALPPEPRSLEDTLADRARARTAQAVAPPVVIDRPEARRAGAGDAVEVSLPTLRTRDSVAGAYRALLRGDYHAALDSYEGVLEEDPRNLQALLGRAAALHKLRRLDEARLAYERVLATESGNREALTNLLAIIGSAAPQEALARLHALERTAPDFTPVLAQIALVYGQMGADGQAVAYLQKAVAQDPANLPYRYNLAVLLDRGGHAQAAAQAYQAVLDGLRARGASASAGDAGASGLSADRIKARLDFLIAAR
ncbi:tetratricopeptide repeat protein [Novispirillum sp. DQ9]|uniref:tetratricopeptide repeat protein n=1 Tax=Novispirillum sp. DQ9 TaxID=3398612 RepID=UPI003C7C21DD